MRIVHRLSLPSRPQALAELSAFGLKIENGHDVSIEVAESDAAWPAVSAWARQREVLDVVRTEFSDYDLLSAELLEMTCEGHYGDPQPESESLAVTYDLSRFCRRCGVGATQRAPFRMSEEPILGDRGILQLHGVPDQFFVTREVFDTCFQPHGVGHHPVERRRGEELRSVVQLAILAEVEIDGGQLPSERCDACGRFKHAPLVRGAFPRLRRSTPVPILFSRAWFGVSSSAWHAVIVAQRVFRSLREQGVRGVSFRPVQSG
jgi:hypothetical protein